MLVDLHLGDLAEVADHPEGHVRERDLHELALAGAAAVALGREQAVVAICPVIASQAGSRWLNGTDRLRGPVAQGKPVDGLTV